MLFESVSELMQAAGVPDSKVVLIFILDGGKVANHNSCMLPMSADHPDLYAHDSDEISSGEYFQGNRGKRATFVG